MSNQRQPTAMTLTTPVPPPAPKLFGRYPFLLTLVADLVDPMGAAKPLALMAVRGLPGVGKTALALGVVNSEHIVHEFPDGRAWLAFGPKPDIFLLLGQLLEQFGVNSSGLETTPLRADYLRTLLAGRRFLLCLDDIWEASHARLFLNAVQPPARTLLTTRSPQVAADLQAANHEVRVLSPWAAVQMLVAGGDAAAGAVAADQAGASSLAADVGYLPLALRVAGRRLDGLARVMGAQTAVAHLREEIASRLLTLRDAEPHLGVDAAEPALAAIVALSEEALPDEVRRALHQLAVFGGQPLDFDLPAMQAVWETDDASATDWLVALHNSGLLETSQEKSTQRFALHQIIAAFASQRLAADQPTAHHAHIAYAKYCAALVAGYDDDILNGRMTYDAPREWAHVTRAIEWLVRAWPTDNEAAQVLLAFTKDWRNVLYTNHDSRRLAWLQVGLQVAFRIGNSWDQANVLQAIGDVQQFRDDRAGALASYGQALALYRQVGSRLGEANVLQAIGDVQQFRDDRAGALASYGQALELFRQVGSRLGEANVLQAIGDVQQFRDDMAGALASYGQALDLYRQVGSRQGEANVLSARARVALGADRETAVELLGQAIELRDLTGDAYGKANDLRNFALALIQRGAATDATPYLAEAKRLFASQNLTGDAQLVDAQMQLAGPFATLFRSQALGEVMSNPMELFRDIGAATANIDMMSLIPLLPPAMQEALKSNDVAAMLSAAAHDLPPPIADVLKNLLNPTAIKDYLLHQAAIAREAGDRESLARHLSDLCEICMEFDDAQTLLAAAEELDEMEAANAETYQYWAEAAFDLGDMEKSHLAYCRAIELDPENASIRRNYANTLIKLKHLDEAASQLDIAETQEPASPYLALRRGELAQARGDRVQAQTWAAEALRRQPDWDEAQAILAWAQEKS